MMKKKDRLEQFVNALTADDLDDFDAVEGGDPCDYHDPGDCHDGIMWIIPGHLDDWCDPGNLDDILWCDPTDIYYEFEAWGYPDFCIDEDIVYGELNDEFDPVVIDDLMYNNN
jgi:hypothetical protein